MSFDGGGNWTFGAKLPVGQFYEVSYDFEVPYNVCSGAQDNGSWCGPSKHKNTPTTNAYWFTIAGGDGFYTAQHPTEPWIVFGESQGGSVALIASSERGSRLPQLLFYPLCGSVPPASRGADYPKTLFVMAANDKLAPASACVDTQARLTAGGTPAASLRLVTMPDAYHAFDLPIPKPMEWLGNRIHGDL